MTLIEEIRRVAAEADCLYTRDEIRTAIMTLAAAVTARLGDTHPIVLTVLNGGLFFGSELLLQLPFPLEVDSIKVGRYQGETQGSALRWTLTPGLPLAGRTVLVIDDILDEGITLDAIIRYCQDAGARARPVRAFRCRHGDVAAGAEGLGHGPGISADPSVTVPERTVH